MLDKLKGKLKKQPKVKVTKQWEGPNPEGKHTYVGGPVRKKT